ncbi:uncharacterized protein [Elaeis guineensis]|uniref:Translin isoform X2 n=1 Tax=Elaeis guineensis var. tenera TaxID=51953 RepID=A0A6I9R2V5_ELAGV|nr:translin isoform X2 [Elaeis guineensis]
MRAAFRTAIPALLSSSAAAVAAFPPCFSVPRVSPLLLLRSSAFSSAMANHPTPPSSSASPSSSTATAAATLGSSSSFSSSMEKQFEDFRVHLEESGSVRERIRGVVMEMEGAIRLMHSSLLLVHQSLPAPEVLEKARVQIGVLKDLFGRLAEILRESPGQYYRYHGDWRSETQTVVSLLAFLHWLETGSLLTHEEAEKKLGLSVSEFGLDIEDYLIGMKYDLRRVEEVYYDVKIRGLSSGGSTKDQTTTQA